MIFLVEVLAERTSSGGVDEGVKVRFPFMKEFSCMGRRCTSMKLKFMSNIIVPKISHCKGKFFAVLPKYSTI